MGAFHVKHNRRTRHAGEHILRKQHHLSVGVDDLAVFCDDSKAVAVAIEGKAQLGVGLFQGVNQVLQILWLARVRVMVGKGAVHLAEQFNHLAANFAKNLRSGRASNTIATVDHDFHGALEANISCNPVAIRRFNVHIAHRPAVLQTPAFALHHLAQGLNLFAVNRAAPHHHLEAVVIFGIVAARDLDAAFAERISRKVEQRRGHAAYVDHSHACLHQPAHQGGRQRWPADAPIAAHSDRGLPFAQGQGAKGAAQAERKGFV